MGLREMVDLVREVHPELRGAKVTVQFPSGGNTCLNFIGELAATPVSVPVAWDQSPEDAFAGHAARVARYRATKAREEAEAATKRATTLADAATKLEARAAELEVAVPSKPGGAP